MSGMSVWERAFTYNKQLSTDHAPHPATGLALFRGFPTPAPLQSHLTALVLLNLSTIATRLKLSEMHGLRGRLLLTTRHIPLLALGSPACLLLSPRIELRVPRDECCELVDVGQ